MISLNMAQLDQVRIAAPCGESWEAMDGNARTRFCAGCGHHVHNLSAMSRAEAQDVLARADGRVCIRFHPKPNGSPMTSEDVAAFQNQPTAPVRPANWPRRWAAAASWAVALLTAGLGGARANVASTHPYARSQAKPGHGLTASGPLYRLGRIARPRRATRSATEHSRTKEPPRLPHIIMGGGSTVQELIPSEPPPAKMDDIALPPAGMGGMMAAPSPPHTMGKNAAPPASQQ